MKRCDTEGTMEEQNKRSGGLTMISENVRKMTKDRNKTVFYISKLIEVVLLIITLTLVSYAFKEYKIRRNFPDFNDTETTIIFTTLYGYLLINIILVASSLFGDKLPKKMVMIFSGTAAILCCITGAILIVDSTTHENDILEESNAEKNLLASGIIAIIASLCFAAETMLTYKYP